MSGAKCEIKYDDDQDHDHECLVGPPGNTSGRQVLLFGKLAVHYSPLNELEYERKSSKQSAQLTEPI